MLNMLHSMVCIFNISDYIWSVNFAGIKEICSSVSRHGDVGIAEEKVQYNYEPVEGDKV